MRKSIQNKDYLYTMITMYTPLSEPEITILSFLSPRPQSTTGIYAQILANSENAMTEQHFYRLLKQLAKKEVITQTRARINLNPIFIKSQATFYNNIDASHEIVNDFSLKEKESAVFRFNNLQAADVFWGDIAVKLSEGTTEDIILYNVHQFILLMRTPNENVYYQKITGEGKRDVYIHIGGNTKHDKEIKNLITTPNVHYWASGERLFKDHVFINVYGNYVLRATFQKPFITKLEDAFKTAHNITTLKESIDAILPTVGKITFRISNSPRRAKRIREKVIKNFK